MLYIKPFKRSSIAALVIGGGILACWLIAPAHSCEQAQEVCPTPQASDGIPLTYNPNWSPTTETRDWSSATSAERCFRIAKQQGKTLVEIIDTGSGDLRYICIMESCLKLASILLAAGRQPLCCCF